VACDITRKVSRTRLEDTFSEEFGLDDNQLLLGIRDHLASRLLPP
jgi:hypothetical protein